MYSQAIQIKQRDVKFLSKVGHASMAYNKLSAESNKTPFCDMCNQYSLDQLHKSDHGQNLHRIQKVSCIKSRFETVQI